MTIFVLSYIIHGSLIIWQLLCTHTHSLSPSLWFPLSLSVFLVAVGCNRPSSSIKRFFILVFGNPSFPRKQRRMMESTVWIYEKHTFALISFYWTLFSIHQTRTYTNKTKRLWSTYRMMSQPKLIKLNGYGMLPAHLDPWMICAHLSLAGKVPFFR